MNCPKCHLENHPTAERCDCGYDFATKTMKDSYLKFDEIRPGSAAGKEARSGLTRKAASWFWFGIAASGLSWASPYVFLELGIVGLAMRGIGTVFGALALLRGIGSLIAIRRFEGGSVGKGYAVAGTILGLVAIRPLASIFLLPLFHF